MKLSMLIKYDRIHIIPFSGEEKLREITIFWKLLLKILFPVLKQVNKGEKEWKHKIEENRVKHD